MLVKIIISIVFGILGLAIGFPVFKLAKHQISVRDKQFPMLREDYPVDLLESKKSFAVFEICFFVTYFFSYFVLGENVVSLIFSLVLSTCCIDLSAVDLAIRRIPNQMLLIILIAGLANDIINPLIYGGSIKQNLVMSLIGIAVSFLIFYIPKLVGLYMGNGDVKLRICTRFCGLHSGDGGYGCHFRFAPHSAYYHKKRQRQNKNSDGSRPFNRRSVNCFASAFKQCDRRRTVFGIVNYSVITVRNRVT